MGDQNQYQEPLIQDHSQLIEPHKDLPLPLSEDEELEISESKQLFYQHLREFLPLVKDMYENDMISGWRDIKVYLTPKKEKA